MNLERARGLRRKMTDTERFAGYKFRRQMPIGAYIVDFVCLERRLIVEQRAKRSPIGAAKPLGLTFGVFPPHPRPLSREGREEKNKNPLPRGERGEECRRSPEVRQSLHRQGFRRRRLRLPVELPKGRRDVADSQGPDCQSQPCGIWAEAGQVQNRGTLPEERRRCSA